MARAQRLVLGWAVATLVAAGLVVGRARAEGVPAFVSPYNSPDSLESFLVFSAPPRENVPDGQIHWVDAEVPGIDVRGPDGILRNMCPEDGLAWTLVGGDTVGGGGQFVAVECLGAAEGWQMLGFHLCEIQIQASISSSERHYTRVPPGAPLARECSHTHLSLGYYAEPQAKREVGCPQWYVQGRYWVNPACLAQARALPTLLPNYLAREDDWELRLLRPEVLEPLRAWALPGLLLALGLYLYLSFYRPAAEPKAAKPFTVSLVKSGVWLGGAVLLVIISAGPLWPVGGFRFGSYSAADAPYQQMAQAVGYRDWQLLKAFYAVAVPRNAQGRPASATEPGKVFPPEAAAAIPFGETNAEDWGTVVDPTQPGPYGQFKAWEAVTERWPVSTYERWVLGLNVSRTAQAQRDGLTAIANNPAMLALGLRLGKTIRAEDLYGSSAGALGRTQILPSHFAPTALCGDMASTDVWNDPLAVAECTTRYLAVSGCWGSWYANGDVWSALCSYNPGAWDVAEHSWYWNVLQDRMTRLAAAELEFSVSVPAERLAAAEIEFGLNANSRPATETVSAPGTSVEWATAFTTTDALSSPVPLSSTVSVSDVSAGEHLVPTPVLGLMVTQTLLQNGLGATALPAPVADVAMMLAPQVQTPERREAVRGLYRVFRAWLLIYYTPEDLLALGVQF